MKAIRLHTRAGPEVCVHAAAVTRIAKRTHVPLAELLVYMATLSGTTVEENVWAHALICPPQPSRRNRQLSR
jgi:hypothetical protein